MKLSEVTGQTPAKPKLKLSQVMQQSPIETKPKTPILQKIQNVSGAPLQTAADAIGKYENVKKPVASFLTKVPGPLNLLRNTPEVNVESPIAKYMPESIRQTLFPKVPLTGPKAAEALAGGGIDTLAAGGVEKLATDGIPGAIRAGKGLARGVGNIGKNVGNLRKPVEFAQSVRGDMFAKRQELGRTLDKAITDLSNASPENPIDLSSHFYEMKGALQNVENPGLASDISNTIRKIKDPQTSRLVQELIRNPENASQLTLRQAEDIKRAISQSPSISQKMKMGKFANWTAGDHELLDLLDNIKNTQAEVHPGLSELRKPYAEYMQNYNQVKNSFKPASLLNKMRGKFGNEEVEAMVQKVLPPETWKSVKGFRNTGKVATGVGVVGAEEVIRNLVLPALGRAFRGQK